jgi:hypothetical protein
VSEPEPPLSPGRPPLEEPPPFLGTWRRVYAALIALLALYIVVFFALGVGYG